MRFQSLVPRAEVLSGRNMLCWTGLAFAAGAVNAIALAACEQFVTHITGVVTHLGMHMGSWRLATEYLAVLICFVVGAMTAVVILDGRRLRGMPSLPWLPLVTVAVLLTFCGVAGHLGLFGAFGGHTESNADFVLLSILAFALGLQNASVANATGSLVRTTHMTGPATDLGVALALLLIHELPEEHLHAARRTVFLRASKLFAFMAGAGMSVLFVPSLQYLALLFPAVICGMVATTLFGRMRIRATPRLLTSE